MNMTSINGRTNSTGAKVPGENFQGTKVPSNIRSWERKFLGAKVPRSGSPRNRKVQGTKVPGSELARVPLELSLQGANWQGSEKAVIQD